MVKSDLFYYHNGINETLRDLQSHIVNSLNAAAVPDVESGYSVHAVVGKGDWKWRREWLQMPRHYSNLTSAGRNGAGICPRCLAGIGQRAWIDIAENFNNDDDLRAAEATAVGVELPFRRLQGWSAGCEYPDMLHCVWLGVARDLIGSMCLDLIEYDASYELGATYDDRLQLLLTEIQTWCRAHGIRPSTLDDLSRSIMTYFNSAHGGSQP